MPRRPAPWMHEAIAHDKARAEAEKLARKARGSRVFAVLPWRADAHYEGSSAIQWFRSRALADKFALSIHGGRGLVVREWTQLRNPDAEKRERSTLELDREIAEAISKYGYGY